MGHGCTPTRDCVLEVESLEIGENEENVYEMSGKGRDWEARSCPILQTHGQPGLSGLKRRETCMSATPPPSQRIQRASDCSHSRVGALEKKKVADSGASPRSLGQSRLLASAPIGLSGLLLLILVLFCGKFLFQKEEMLHYMSRGMKTGSKGSESLHPRRCLSESSLCGWLPSQC